METIYIFCIRYIFQFNVFKTILSPSSNSPSNTTKFRKSHTYPNGLSHFPQNASKIVRPTRGRENAWFFFENSWLTKAIYRISRLSAAVIIRKIWEISSHTQLVVCLLCSLLGTVHLLYIQSNLENCHRLGSISSAMRINQDWRWINRGQWILFDFFSTFSIFFGKKMFLINLIWSRCQLVNSLRLKITNLFKWNGEFRPSV